MAQIEIADFFRQALKHLESGNLDQAKNLFSELLLIEPENADIIHALGIMACQNRDFHEAIPLLKKAVQIESKRPEFYNNLGNAFKMAGLFSDAVEAFCSALELCPESSAIHLNLAKALTENGSKDEADIHYQYAALLPEKPIIAHYQAALAWLKVDRNREAIKCFEHLLRLQPDCPESYSNLGTAHFKSGNFELAIANFRQALELQPDNPEAHYNWGAALQSQGHVDLAISMFQSTLEKSPEHINALKNLAKALREKRNINASLSYYRRALVLQPDDPELHSSYSLTLLLNGEFSEGWKAYEWRLKSIANPYKHKRNYAQHRWHGENLKNKTLFVYAEQGLGDTLQFSRYIPVLSSMGFGKIIFECQLPLKRLMSTCFGDISDIVEFGETLPVFDVHCPLMSLPFEFCTTLDTIPNKMPYLWVDEKLAQEWQKQLGKPNTLRVGLTWAGNPSLAGDKQRSFDFSLLSPLLKLAGIQFFSLQKGDASQQSENIIDYSQTLNDFADTAALISQLDLVISVDTSVAHLAGAMGIPVWLLSRFEGDWRWLLNREDTPWYPSMLIFRQEQPGDWQAVIKRVTVRLSAVFEGTILLV